LLAFVLKRNDDEADEDVDHEESDDNDVDEVEDSDHWTVVVDGAVVRRVRVNASVHQPTTPHGKRITSNDQCCLQGGPKSDAFLAFELPLLLDVLYFQFFFT